MVPRDPADPRLSPILLRRELLANGVHDRAIAALVAQGALVKVRHGAYVDGDSWRRCDEAGRHALRARAVFKAAQAELALSHVSAAVEWDVPVWDTDLSIVNTTRMDQKPGRRHDAGVIQHVGELRPGDLVERMGVRITSPTRTAVDCMTAFDVEHGVTTLNDLLHRGLTTLEAVDECIAFMEQWPGTLNHRVVRRLATAKPESVGENRSWFLFWNQGLPMPEPQFEVIGPRGETYRVDFAWPERRVFVEFDGRIKYDPSTNDGRTAVDVVLREKRREELVSEMTGWRCIRITWADLYHRERTAARIRAAFTYPVAAVR